MTTQQLSFDEEREVRVYEVAVKGFGIQGAIIVDGYRELVDQVETHLDPLTTLAVGDKPAVITITDGDGEVTTLTITRKTMTKAEREALPEFEGW